MVLGLLWSVNVFANDLINKQLECINTAGTATSNQYYKFINDKEVMNYYILRRDLKVKKHKYDYKAYPNKIEINWGTIHLFDISRKTLKTTRGNSCKVVNFDIKKHLEKKSRQLLEKATKDNKI